MRSACAVASPLRSGVNTSGSVRVPPTFTRCLVKNTWECIVLLSVNNLAHVPDAPLYPGVSPIHFRPLASYWPPLRGVGWLSCNSFLVLLASLLCVTDVDPVGYGLSSLCLVSLHRHYAWPVCR